MRTDILGCIPQVGDAIVRAKYARDNSLHVAKVTGFTKNGDPKVDHYTRDRAHGSFTKRTTWNVTGTVQGDFLILEGVSL